MNMCITPRPCRKTSLASLVAVLSAISLSCNALSGQVHTASDEPGEPASSQDEAPLEAVEAPAVMGFVLHPDGAPVAYASVAGEISDSNGAVSGDLAGSASGWLEVQTLGYATGFAKPGEGIGGTAFFEARLTPFEALRPLESGEEVVLTLGDVAQPVAEISLTSEDVSALPAFIEAAIYDRVDVGPYLAELDSGQVLDLKLALAVEATPGQTEPVSLASGKTVTLKLFPNANLPADPVMAIFGAEKGMWEVQAGACTPGEEGTLLCALPRFAPLVGFFGPGEGMSLTPSLDPGMSHVAAPAGKHVPIQAPTDDDQAYQDAKTDVEEWGRIGQGEQSRSGTNSPEWQAEMTNRLGVLADAAEAYGASHPDVSGISHLLGAAQLAILLGDQGLANELIAKAQATAESMADELLKESDCGRIREMAKMVDLLTSLGALAKADALLQKMQKVGDCDVWVGTIRVWFHLVSTNPGLDRYAQESGGGSWFETHQVTMTTNVVTYVLKGEDHVSLDFPEVKYGYKDRDNCEHYLTHGGEGGGSINLKFDGRYDGYTFTVGDLQPEGGGAATITYGAHAERWDSVKEECEIVGDETVPAPNYMTVLRHGFTGSPPITIQDMLQGGNNETIRGSEQISNDAFELGIYPFQTGHIFWSFFHLQKHLPVNE